ncbi:MAG: 6-bladed beta-propeller [Candidatus Krumholzibacteriia bacterium]
MRTSILAFASCVALSCLPAVCSAHEIAITPLFIGGGRGSGIGKFGTPESVAIDSAGRIVVTDKGHMRLHIFASDDGRPLFDVGRRGSGPLEFNRPNGIVVDGEGRILIAEQINRRVQILDPEYGYVGEFGSRGSGEGQFHKAMGIAVDSKDRIYVTDEVRGDVQVFDRNGTFLWSFGKKNPRLGKVESIEVDERSGRIFVCDEGKSRVNVYDLNGNYLHAFGGHGSGPGEFAGDPNAVRVDDHGRIYVNDQGNSRINVYAPDTGFLVSFRNGAGGMRSADGCALSEEHNLFLVADQGNDRVLAFDLGAMQCWLAWAELESPADSVGGLKAHADPGHHEPTTLLWADARLVLEAVGSGDPARADEAVVRLSSRRDPNGICVRLVETAAGSGRFVADALLAESSDELARRLATFETDTLRAHLPGQEEPLSIGLTPLPAPEVHGVRIDGAEEEPCLTNPSPRLTWTFVDPAGLRSQTAFELRVRRQQDDGVVWQSTILEGATASFAFHGPPLPTGTPLRFEVRVRSGRARSAWRGVRFRRNTPPRLPRRVFPVPGAVLRSWPVQIQAAIPADVETAGVEVRIELLAPGGDVVHSPDWSGVYGMLRWTPPDVELPENGTLGWRLILSDGLERLEGPWWNIHLSAIEEPPEPAVPVAPRPGASVHGERLTFQWQAGWDPDPEQELLYSVEWSHDAGLGSWQSEPATTDLEYGWEGPREDGTIHWRLRTRDPSGFERTSSALPLHLRRTWQLRLVASDVWGVSDELVLGSRPGAHDEFVPGEDVETPVEIGRPQLVALHFEPRTRDLLVDVRRPVDVGLGKESRTYALCLRGPPLGSMRLQATGMDLPETWEVRLLDEPGATLGTLPRTGSWLEVEIDARGERTLTLEIRERHRSAARSDLRGGAQIHAAKTAGAPRALALALARIPNPLRQGVQLVHGAEQVSLEVWLYDVRGRRARAWLAPTAIIWDGRRADGTRLPAGWYVLRFRTPHFDSSRKLLWIGR